MIEVSWWLYFTASLVVIIVPGQDMVLVMSRGLGQGARPGILTAAGVSTGLLGHTLLATAGLSALLQASALTFTMVKVLGAAYLCYLGLALLLSRGRGLTLNAVAGDGSQGRIFLQGLLSNLSNPKIVVFFFAFLPQFVEPGAAQTLTLVTLGSLFAAMTFLVIGPMGFFAGRLSGWLRARPAALT